MKDLHSHLLPGVDDGAKVIEHTRDMLKSAREAGVTDIMFTPHYVKGSKFSSTAQVNNEIFEDIKVIAKEEYDINAYLGNEIYLVEGVLRDIKSGKCNTLNGSKYILCEIPMHQRFNNLKSVFIEIMNAGYKPILAHPERYSAYLGDYEFFIQLYELGVKMQINYPSLLGMYGSKPKKMAKKLLKMGIIDFVGSDIHSVSELKYEKLDKAMKKLKRIVGNDRFYELTEYNFELIVKDRQID